ncbi:MAG: fibrinogen-like YCDxxxxGGGW domain-containing protein [Candidatus Aureabacteria bacterium]|nr:fibrinogen-like YCDxxxxGGGW domain-containing protein [Candidatus Auribacterota bacterium]
MKKLITAALSLLFVICMSYTAIAGSLDSPGAPSAGSGMYTLQNLYDFLTSGTALTVQTSFQEPTSGPGSTMKSTKEIGDDVASLFGQCPATAADVKSGVKFFSTVPGSWGVQTGTFVVPTPTASPTPIYASCKAIKTANPTASDGVYTIDPDGSGGNAAFSAYCDMTSDGGGWTLILKTSAANTSELAYNTDYWATTATLGSTEPTVGVGSEKYIAYNVVPFSSLRGCVNSATSNCIIHTFTPDRASALSVFGCTTSPPKNGAPPCNVESTQETSSDWGTALGASLNCSLNMRCGFNVDSQIGGASSFARWGCATHNPGLCQGCIGFGCQGNTMAGCGRGSDGGGGNTDPHVYKDGWLWVR